MTNTEAIQRGRSEAQRTSVTGWAFFGFFLPIPALIVVLARSPRMEPLMMAAHEDRDTLPFYEAEYIRALKSRQVKRVLIWGGVSIALTTFFLVLLFAAGIAASMG